MLLLCFSSSSCFHTSSRRLAVSMTRWMVDFKAMRPPLLSSVISGLSSPVSLPLLPARLPLIVCHLLPKRCLSAVGFGDFEARFCRTTTMIAFLRGFSSSSDNTISFPLPVLQIEDESNITSPPVIQVPSGICLPVTSFMEKFLFPIFPPLLSGLDVQASSVLQGSSSRLMVFSACDAVFVTLWVALDAVFQEVHEIVLVFRFLMAFYELYCQSIFRHLLPCFHVFSLLLVVLFTLSIEFEASK
ncbi:uncharacterized protein LOC112081846 isoform X2 [Eutrema salsugineum]|uniref:uncharacterized protein LOC112081846 isoform X2 n=1 Tax=Eutrema salsugineum TaxID=72664 RepID=UPI000CED54A2|nr:uncharacterized protein LOC112081846 isoform X2 [Eutrema salsugineum]